MADYQQLEDNLEDDVGLPEQQQGGGHAAEAPHDGTGVPDKATGRKKHGKEKKRKRDKGKKRNAGDGDEEDLGEEGEEEEEGPGSLGGTEEEEEEDDGNRAYRPDEAVEVDVGNESDLAEDAEETLFGRKRKKKDESTSQMTMVIDEKMAKMEAAADLDVEARTAGRPAINKLKMLGEVKEFLAQRKYHELFIHSGGLGVLKAWLEPYADGTLPNASVRTCVLACCKELPIDTARDDIKENLKKSQLGSRIMFLAKCQDETQANRKIALELVQKWSRPIFFDPEAEAEKKRAREEALKRARLATLDLTREQDAAVAAAEAEKKKIKYGQPGYRWHASIPQTLKLDYVVAPQGQSAVSEAASEMQRTGKKDESRLSKKMREVVRKQKGATARAAVPSVEGRNIIF